MKIINMSVTINVNGTSIEAREGETVLNVLNENGIKVPTLCHLKNMFPTGSCRMCVVEHKNQQKLITSCSALLKTEWRY